MKREHIPRRKIERVDEALAEVLRAKTLTERAAMVFDANDTMRLLLEGAMRTRHPDWDDRQIRQAIARRMLGETG